MQRLQRYLVRQVYYCLIFRPSVVAAAFAGLAVVGLVGLAADPSAGPAAVGLSVAAADPSVVVAGPAAVAPS